MFALNNALTTISIYLARIDHDQIMSSPMLLLSLFITLNSFRIVRFILVQKDPKIEEGL